MIFQSTHFHEKIRCIRGITLALNFQEKYTLTIFFTFNAVISNREEFEVKKQFSTGVFFICGISSIYSHFL